MTLGGYVPDEAGRLILTMFHQEPEEEGLEDVGKPW